MSTLADDLRTRADVAIGVTVDTRKLMDDAADALDRLQRERDAAREEVERLREERDDLSARLHNAIATIDDWRAKTDEAREQARTFYQYIRDNCHVMLLSDAVKEHPWLEEA